MNIGERIQKLRKESGMSQEGLADVIGVSRQAVSKWESGQSLPDTEKIVLMCEHFGVSSDYILRGTESLPDHRYSSRVFTAAATVLNFAGLIVSAAVWIERQTVFAAAIGLILMAIGCTLFAVGQLRGEKGKNDAADFFKINIWFLTLIPFSCIFNALQEISYGSFPSSFSISPLPHLGNSVKAYMIFWVLYFVICAAADIFISKRQGNN